MVLALAGFLGWAVVAEMPLYVVIVFFVLALQVLSISRRATTEIMVDERLQAINEKASAG